MKMIAKLIGVLSALTLLAACGGGGSASFTSTAGTGGTSGTSSGGTAGTSTSGGYTLLLSSNLSTISAGGSTGLTAKIVDSTNAAYSGTPVPVTFTSLCTGNGLATITSPVTTNNGIANATYTDMGCSATDTITATATVNSAALTTTTTIVDQDATVGSVVFVSATPSTIAIQGSGGAGLSSTATVVFKVNNSAGGVRPNAAVSFALSTSVGGITLSPASGTTDNNGLVTTVVTSGTIHTAVWVTATVTGTSISTQSSKLDISTGIPDQDSFSLSIKTLNPETWTIDGVVDAVTVQVADHFNNPAPDGTTITFTADGGQIGPSCQTTAGSCSVNWTSSSPRPSNGRVVIMASTIGEESFTDVNGNGYYDSGEPFTDMPEAWRDDNENGVHDSGEDYIDFNHNNLYDAANGLYKGSLCKSNCDPNATSLEIFKNEALVLASSDQVISVSPSQVDLPSGGTVVAVLITVQDARGQVPPAGTTVSASTSNGKIVGASSFTVPNTVTGPYTVYCYLQTDGTASTGAMLISATTPGGVVSTYSVPVTDH